MKHRVAALVALLVLALAAAGSAFAFDCIRVSSSFQGLQQSTKSGNWALFDLSSGARAQETLGALGIDLTTEQASCLSSTYAQSGQPLFWALGIGVAAGENPNAAAGGVLAGKNPNDDVLGNLKGIDHLDDSPIGAALFAAAGACGIPVGD